MGDGREQESNLSKFCARAFDFGRPRAPISEAMFDADVQASDRGRLRLRLISHSPATMSRNITVTYDLNPPQGVSMDSIARNRTLSLPVSQVANGERANKRYYDGLRTAIAQAKDTVGEELTAWRDAVGNLEQTKEPKVSKTEDEEDEEAESEE